MDSNQNFLNDLTQILLAGGDIARPVATSPEEELQRDEIPNLPLENIVLLMLVGHSGARPVLTTFKGSLGRLHQTMETLLWMNIDPVVLLQEKLSSWKITLESEESIEQMSPESFADVRYFFHFDLPSFPFKKLILFSGASPAEKNFFIVDDPKDVEIPEGFTLVSI